MTKKYRIGLTGFEYYFYDNIQVEEVLKGNILELTRYDVEIDGKNRQDLVLTIKDCNDNILELIMRYTSREARQIMNIMACLNAMGIKDGKNVKIFFLSDVKDNKPIVNIRIEKEGRHITWLYDELPEAELNNGILDYTNRDQFWDDIYPQVKGLWE
jgi:hypothetical protein